MNGKQDWKMDPRRGATRPCRAAHESRDSFSVFVELKAEARRAALARGHRLVLFSEPLEQFRGANGWTNLCAHAHCRDCGREVQVMTRTAPNEIDIGGEAVACNCDGGAWGMPLLDVHGRILRLCLEGQRTFADLVSFHSVSGVFGEQRLRKELRLLVKNGLLDTLRDARLKASTGASPAIYWTTERGREALAGRFGR